MVERRQGPIILVVDDEESSRERCRRILEEDGYRAGVARGGEQALQLVKLLGPSVVVVDLAMRGMDGLEVVERLHEFDPDIATIVISGHGTLKAAMEAMRTGASGFLCKPLDSRTLLDAVGRGLGHGEPGGVSSERQRPRTALPRNAMVILEILERAACDEEFATQLAEQGAGALEAYGLTWEEKDALLRGDLRWIEAHVGGLPAGLFS